MVLWTEIKVGIKKKPDGTVQECPANLAKRNSDFDPMTKPWKNSHIMYVKYRMFLPSILRLTKTTISGSEIHNFLIACPLFQRKKTATSAGQFPHVAAEI